MDVFENASVLRDAHGYICQMNHLDAPYRASPNQGVADTAFAAAGMTPRKLADEYLHDAMPRMGLSEVMFHSGAAGFVASNPPEQLVFHEEKRVMDNATVTYDQMIEGIPVWESGVVVQVEMSPMQVIGSQSSVKRAMQVQMPPLDLRLHPQSLNPNGLKKLLGIGQRLEVEISHKELFIYQYLEADRLAVHRDGPTGQAEPPIPFVLPQVAVEIREGGAFVVTAVQFTLGSKEAGTAGWLALIEVKTGSVLLLRSLVGCAYCGTISDTAAESDTLLVANAASLNAVNTNAASSSSAVVFFDIGDTLGSAVSDSSGNLARIDLFPTAREVVKELSETNIRVGIITDPGSFSHDLILSLLQDTGIFAFVDRNLVVQGSKNSTTIFTDAASLAGVAANQCVFVGENAAERSFATAAGFRVVAVPDRVIALVDPSAALAWVYLQDPRTKAGSAAPGPEANLHILDPFRDLVSLSGLTPATTGTNQTLSGEFVRLQEVELPVITSPSSPPPGDFRFAVNTNDFGAVNAYYNCDRLFRLLSEFGIDVRNYFDGTTFPVKVDSRIRFDDGSGVPTANSVNASSPGFRFPPSSDGFRFALAAVNTSVGMAADWRVVLHEFGHALLWDHVGSPNFKFAHSTGDSLAAILNDVGNRAQRGVTFPWVIIGRSHTRSVTDFAWYGTRYDPFGDLDGAGYVAEQMLSSTLFRLYLAAGGDSTNRETQELAASYVVFLIFKSIGLMSLNNNPATPEAYADLLMQADTGVMMYRGVTTRIGLLRKAIRWAFEMQGAYRQPALPGQVRTNRIGNPPAVDVFINDGRDGQYRFVGSSNSTEIWNRQAPDNGTVHQEPVVGEAGFAYVRVSNRGMSAANQVVVNSFQSSLPDHQIWPSDWEPLVNASIAFPFSILPGQSAVVGPFQWVPNSLTPTLFMSVSATGDLSNLARFSNVNPIDNQRLVPLDNNLAQRSMTATMHPVTR